MFTHTPSPYPIYGHVQGYYFPAAPEHIPFPSAPPMYPHPPLDGFSHLAPPPYTFEAPQPQYLPPYAPPMPPTATAHTATHVEESIPPIQISIADPDSELKTLTHTPAPTPAATTVTVSQTTNAAPTQHQPEIPQEKIAPAIESLASLQRQGFLPDLKSSPIYVDNAPRPQWLEKHVLAKAGLTPEDFLSVGHFEKYSSKYLALRKGLGHAVVGAIPTSAAALGVTIAALAGASVAVSGPFAPAVFTGIGLAGAAPIVIGGTIGHFRSKEERAKYEEQMRQMKSALDENPEKYSAYLRTGMTSMRTGAKARNANKEGVTKLRNYLESGAEKSVLWKAYFPVASDKIMVVTTVDPKNAAQLFYKALSDVTQKAAKKASKQAAHLA